MNYQAPHQHLHDRVILVTGAGAGIGKTAALAFAAQGATLVLVGRMVSRLEETYDEIETAGGAQPAIFPLDLEKSGEAEFNTLADAIYLQLGRLDAMLHNAAYFRNLSPLENQNMQLMTDMFQVNVAAPFALTKACLPLLKVAPDASVLFTSTTAAHYPAAYWGAHAISKSALETLVKIWAQELEIVPNLRINAIIPGAVQSPQRKRSHPGETPAKLLKPDAIMPLYLYLMGHDSAGVSGQVFEAQKF